MTNYLARLTERLSSGLTRLPESARQRQVDYLAGLQNPDGGFSGREGGSDLYYTGFALRGLAVLDGLTSAMLDRTAGFLRTALTSQASVIDFFSLLYSCLLLQAAGGPDVLAESPTDWPDRVAATLEQFRTPDGGFGRSPGQASASTYHSFLVALCYELLGRPVPRAGDLARLALSRHREDGGFVEVEAMRRSGTNPTAAAVGLLRVLESQGEGSFLSPDARLQVIKFLTAMPSPEGGLRANSRIPLADLLSTFTGLWTLHDLEALDQVDTSAALAYAQSLETPDGGFRGGAWDTACDVEYTFYGLGVLGLLVPLSR